MTEYWVNVYKYPKLTQYCYSHACTSREQAKKYANPNYVLVNAIGPRKVLYRIHIKLKPKPSLSKPFYRKTHNIR
jgi:hypothetical protein